MLWYDNFTDCYIGLIEKVYTEPEYISAPRGLKIKECLGVGFGLKNPRARLPYVPGRKFSIRTSDLFTSRITTSRALGSLRSMDKLRLPKFNWPK